MSDERKGRAWQKLRLQVLERDGGVCAYCGGEATTADHVVPLKAGGLSNLGNTVAASVRCNSSKGARLLVRLNYINRAWLDRL